MSWVEEEASRIKREDERQENQRRWAIHKAEVLTQSAVKVWTAVADQVKKDLQKINENFAGDERRQVEFQEIPAFGFLLKKKSGLLFQITVRMATDGRSLQTKIEEVRKSLGVPIVREDSVIIDLDEEENFIFTVEFGRTTSLEVVSKAIFKPLIDRFQY